MRIIDSTSNVRLTETDGTYALERRVSNEDGERWFPVTREDDEVSGRRGLKWLATNVGEAAELSPETAAAADLPSTN